MRTKRKVRPNYTIKKGTTIKPTGSSSSTLWEILIIIVLLVCGLLFVVASLENVNHKQHTADGPQPGEADSSNAVPTKGVWERYTDADSNAHYYYNTETKKVVWKTPMEWKDGEEQKGWIRWYDTNSSSFFYENAKTKELVWEPPLEAFPEDVATEQTESKVVETPESVVATKAVVAETTTQCRQVWCRFQDANNMSFYQHKTTKQTTWATPKIWKRKGELVPELKGDWLRIPNKNTVAKDAPKFYYYQQQTKLIQWDVPIAWKEVNSTEDHAQVKSASSSSESSEQQVGLRGSGKPPQPPPEPPQPPQQQQQQLTTGVVEKGGWVQVKDKDSASSKFYYYRKGQAATTTTWETPKPFMTTATTGSHVAQTHVDGIVGQGWCRYYTVMKNKDIKGGDVSLTGVRVKNVEACCGKCSSNIQCRSWSFSIDTCWMKNKLMAEEDDTRLVAKTGVESGYFLEVPPSQ
jgi:hypothetical protein